MKIVHIFCSPDGVRFLRGALELTLNDIAKLTNLTKQTIIDYEKGKRKSFGSTDLIIGVTMANVLEESDLHPDIKKDIFDMFFRTEIIEL